ncbi:triose-phosphate isomerase [Actimicrobium sp. CCC2.4]|uniref:triose-phosphate isomerase n=1 Tax=Actimicrobium sp. CCC2.4 TaxID=3048606 RepID=UPI002AC98999|nr:triose-phosphate isomerase [Actimicrobium sp. CCC2.4]MEB0135640.1 triose-phosphate isomerase [Actimicrobium sp. CCC2.4]WPX33798.1 triose-phosphate isomerase [Actimicrobium sp. CCC2.4]
MRRKLVAGNWKMNGNLAANSALLYELVAAIGHAAPCDIAVCVPAPYLALCQQQLTNTAIAWGGQDLSAHEAGAYTGEVSATMLTDFRSHYVVVGHSERRAMHGENNALVAQKTVRALRAGLVPIVCVGETLSEREAGRTMQVVGDQLNAVLALLEPADLTRIVVAYEPVWAIGTGKTATPDMAQEVHAGLRQLLAAQDALAAAGICILYGGSMKPDNARELMAMADIDGGLIGGAALKSADFLAIIAASSNH